MLKLNGLPINSYPTRMTRLDTLRVKVDRMFVHATVRFRFYFVLLQFNFSICLHEIESNSVLSLEHVSCLFASGTPSPY